ncbi:Hsp70 family protein [Desulfococcus sp.]|uniref:Hsp70 family protein n=1 Tax=Desulfococcus sp. TaxID=2025834 RepID=UPI003D133E14
MDANDKRYIIGIDLGTTNSAVSYVDMAAENGDSSRIRLFQIPQLTGAGEFSRLPVLPSFLYIPGDYDISKSAITIPWKTEDDNFVGAFSRDHGASVPARLVSSAKSWLCHDKADRHARILPWGAEADVNKVSPVTATAYFLKHIRNAWNHAMGDEVELYMENQFVTLTVPASFDEVARDMTLEAAALAGFGPVTLLEEPLAAFYSWLTRHEKDWDDHVKPDELILVCDVGGGTTDFTLITLREVDGSPRFERIAVGDHLILGGDNIDLALARHAEAVLFRRKTRGSLTGDRWKMLCHQCRQAKEMLLDGLGESRKITLMGKGRKVIGDVLTTELGRKEVEHIVLEGFFPVVDRTDERKAMSRKGITEFGLPYEPEPAITRHMGWFLEHHGEDVMKALGRNSPAPDLILFNGGSLKSRVIQDRIREALRHWFGISDTALPRVLANPNPDTAVALGAAYYGLVRAGRGVRVGSGSARAYYMGVRTDSPRQEAVCIVERGLDEGSRIILEDRTFEVLTNQPVFFEVFSSSFRSGDKAGDLVVVDDTLTPLPPLRTVIQFGKKGAEKLIPVDVEAEYTEVGTLGIWCRSRISDHRWQLRFQLRDAGAAADVSETEVFDESVVDAVCRKIENAFSSDADPKALTALVKDIGGMIDRPRDQWPLTLIRKMADALLGRVSARGARHLAESRWLNLLGYCLRPGMGDGFDEHRIRKLWKIYKGGPIHGNNPQVRSEWWIMWRRVAGGLKPGQQRQFIQDLTPVMFPKKEARVRVAPQEYLEIWMAVANMELLLVKDKIKWGRKLLSELNDRKAMPQHFWSLSRMGARDLLYGPVDRVIPPDEAARWIAAVLDRDWPDPRSALLAAAQMSRKTGDRIRDVDDGTTRRVIDALARNGASADDLRPLREVVPMKQQEINTVFGEALPTGIVLRAEGSK